jgi:ribosomal protein S18 acetylase RimI-like enzyme
MRDTEERGPIGLQLPLRLATRKDVRALAELTDYAGHGIPGYLWSQSADEGRPPIEIGIERILRERANFSYRNAVIAEVDGRVAAALLAYRLPEHSDVNLDELPDLLRPLEELEQKVPGTFYINILAAYPEYRGLGLGTTLLEAAHTLASEAGCNELSLEVFEENEDAVRLYERHGYREIARLPTVPHPIYKYEGNIVLMTRSVIGQSLIQNRD